MHGTKFDEALLPEISAGREAIAKDQLRWLDTLMVEAGSPDFITGGEIMLADVQLFAILDWSKERRGGPGWCKFAVLLVMHGSVLTYCL